MTTSISEIQQLFRSTTGFHNIRDLADFDVSNNTVDASILNHTVGFESVEINARLTYDVEVVLKNKGLNSKMYDATSKCVITRESNSGHNIRIIDILLAVCYLNRYNYFDIHSIIVDTTKTTEARLVLNIGFDE